MRYSQPAEIEYLRLDPRPRCTPPILLSASKLAEAAGVEKQWFKSNVRKLKKLGLTESLAVGYRLSPRGIAFLDHAIRARD